jgi:nucleolar protein 12
MGKLSNSISKKSEINPKLAQLFTSLPPIESVHETVSEEVKKARLFANQLKRVSARKQFSAPSEDVDSDGEISMEESLGESDADVQDSDGQDSGIQDSGIQDSDRKEDIEMGGKEKQSIQERNKQTCFVGNIPTSVLQRKYYTLFKQHIKSILSQEGAIQSIRFRSVAVNNLKVPKRIAIVSKSLQPARDTLNAYIVFNQPDIATEFAEKANGTLFLDKHLRVDLASSEKKDTKRTIFVGNLPYDVKEETLWSLFSDCGELDNVRVVRDKRTSMGKGIAYVSFKDRASVGLALELNGSKVKSNAKDEGSRKIRVSKAMDSDKAKDVSNAFASKRAKGKSDKPAKPPKLAKKRMSKVELRRQANGDAAYKRVHGKPSRSSVFEGTKAKKGDVVLKPKDMRKPKKPRHVPRPKK